MIKERKYKFEGYLKCHDRIESINRGRHGFSMEKFSLEKFE